MFYASRTMAHGNDTGSEVIGTAGALAIGRNPRLNRVEIADAHGVRNECTPTFFDRFEDAFLYEAQAFVAEVRNAQSGQGAGGRIGEPSGATLADALEATRIGSALRTSLETGQAVTL
jgi:myo-inositol 2-dehydrogenase/D-chiro-inositol 1-dehydrogenase